MDVRTEKVISTASYVPSYVRVCVCTYVRACVRAYVPGEGVIDGARGVVPAADGAAVDGAVGHEGRAGAVCVRVCVCVCACVCVW